MRSDEIVSPSVRWGPSEPLNHGVVIADPFVVDRWVVMVVLSS